MKPQVGDLLGEPPVALTTESRGDHLGRLFTDLAGHRRLAGRQQAGDVRARWPAPLSLVDRALEPLQHRRGGRAGFYAVTGLERGEKARPLPGVTGDAFLVHLD